VVVGQRQLCSEDFPKYCPCKGTLTATIQPSGWSPLHNLEVRYVAPSLSSIHPMIGRGWMRRSPTRSSRPGTVYASPDPPSLRVFHPEVDAAKVLFVQTGRVPPLPPTLVHLITYLSRTPPIMASKPLSYGVQLY